jgi:hypothetical protein
LEEAGYLYKAYYNKNAGNSKTAPTKDNAEEFTYGNKKLTVDGKTYTSGSTIEWTDKTDKSNYKDNYLPSVTQTSYDSQSETTSSPDEKQLIKRYIERSSNYNSIIIENVLWAKRDASGNALYVDGVLQTDSYTAENPLNLFKLESGVSVQQYFFSQCYSKNYPFYVNVIFEQIQ